jgi:hypothetical protein
VDPSTPEDYFGDDALGLAVFARVHAALVAARPDVTVRVTRSQVAFRRRRGFAYLWRPGRYLRHPAADVVLSLALDERLASPRFKEVVHPGPWMHHLEIHVLEDVDDEVLGWLDAAAAGAG